MSKKIKKAIKIASAIILTIIVIIATFFTVKYLINKSKIDNVCDVYSNDKVQERLIEDSNSVQLQMDGETVIGVIKIDKINFEGLIYKGTNMETLDKGVGHFENTPYLNGNVCLAAHNSNQFWKKLHTLEKGDTITYISFLGTKDYEVSEVKQIDSTDWSMLENTEKENNLTLITCVRNTPEKRLCVQATEIK